MEGFEILDKLGEGAYSVVYKVKRKEDSNIYALKKVKLKGLSDKEKQNALNEVRILASVKSPFVISYKEAFIEEESEALCIVMEYADKGDLYQKIVHLKKIGCLIEEIDAWKIFIQMVRGLKSLHDLKILHRDLKSANIFLFSDGTAKIGDLNVSKVAQKGLGYTQTGTPYYASPEVWNENPYDNKSDIWSLGCVTYEMLTLHPPFRAKNMEELYNRVIKGQYKRIGDKYSEDMNEIINFLLKVNPKERPNCDDILKHPIIRKRLEFFQAQAGENEGVLMDNMDEGVLLRTIRIPKNIIFLSDNLPEKNYGKSKSHSKAMGRNVHKFSTSIQNDNNNSSLPNISILNNLKTNNLRSVQVKKNILNNNDIKGEKEINDNIDNNSDNLNNNNNINNIDLNKGLKGEKSNIVVNKNIIYNINNVVNINNQKKANKKEKTNVSRSPQYRQMVNKYDGDSLDKNNLNLIQMERRRLYGKNILGPKKRKIDDIYKHFIPMYGNNRLLSLNKYGINTKSDQEINQLLPNIYSNKSLGDNYSNNTGNKIIINRRLKPIISKKI